MPAVTVDPAIAIEAVRENHSEHAAATHNNDALENNQEVACCCIL